MAIMKKALVLDTSANQHRELIEGAEVLTGSTIQISSDDGNILSVGTDGGLLASSGGGGGINPEDLISTDSPNLIKIGSDGALFAKTPQSTDFISSQTGNQLVLASLDQKLFVGNPVESSLISTNVNNAITTGSDGKLFSPKVDGSSLISTAGGNNLHTTSDGGLYISVTDSILIDNTDQVLTKNTLGIKGNVSLNYLPNSRTVQLLGKNDTLISSIVLPEAAVLEGARTETNPSGHDPGTYLILTFTTSTGPEDVYINMDAFITIYTAGDNSIDITGFQVRVKLDPNAPFAIGANGIQIVYTGLVSSDSGNLLQVGSDGKLKAIEPAPAGRISSNENNILVLGTDGKYFVPATVVPGPSTQVPLVASGSGSVGTGTTWARADHVHPAQPVPSPATITPLVASGSGNVGNGTNYARDNHVHPAQSVPSPATVNPNALGTAAPGTSLLYARQDHVHPMIATAGNGSASSAGTIGISQAAQWTNTTDANDFVSPAMLRYAFPSSNGFGMNAGRYYVDFSQMSQTDIDNILKQIKVPIWLTSNTNFYVRPDGNDSNDGLSNNASGAFKTIQGALDNISSNYNLNVYSVTINVADGQYSSFRLPKYNTSTGIINIVGASREGVVITGENIGAIRSVTNSGSYVLRNFTVELICNNATTILVGVSAVAGCEIQVYNCTINMTRTSDPTSVRMIAFSAPGGILHIRTGGIIISITGAQSNRTNAISATTLGLIHLYSSFEINGSYDVVAIAADLSTIRKAGDSTVVISGDATGRRYSASTNSIINTQNGGANFFPGTIAGTITTGGQYS